MRMIAFSRQRRPAFTLIELLLSIGIIAILAAVVIVAINPRKQLRDATDARRTSFARELGSAVTQHVIDHRGNFPEPDMIGEGKDFAVDLCTSGTGGHTDCVDLSDELLPTYMVDFDQDPAERCPYKAGYLLYRLTGRVQVEARHLGKLSGDADIVRDCVDDRTWITQLETQGNGDSLDPVFSPDGRYLFFDSDASVMVSGDANGERDVFMTDRENGGTERISVSSGGVEGNDGSFRASASTDGRYIAFLSDATNLVGSDTNGARDVFLRNRQDETTTLLSVATGGGPGNNLSGPFANRPVITADGAEVAFDSRASNLIASDSNAVDDIFVRNWQNDTMARVSVATDGTAGNGNSNAPSMSADGRYVVFQSSATNLVTGDTNGVTDIFLHDRDTDADGIFDEAGAISTIRISVATDATQANGSSLAPAVSSDGLYVAFLSDATNLVADDTNGVRDAFLYSRARGTVTRISVATDATQANGSSFSVALNADGRYIIFDSSATNLVTGDTNSVRDVFLYDRRWGITRRISTETPGVQATGASQGSAVSDDGTRVAFFATDSIVAGDTNGVLDVHVVELEL